MTVKELIEELQKYPENFPVFYESDFTGQFNISEVFQDYECDYPGDKTMFINAVILYGTKN